MRYSNYIVALTVGIVFSLSACSNQNDNTETNDDCSSDIAFDQSRGNCNETLKVTSSFNVSVSGSNRIITANSIPNHKVGLFGNVQGSLNPNAISAQSESYTITTSPTVASELTPLLSSRGPAYSFGVLLNGVELDPIAAEPFPHQGMMSPNVNWEWNLEATNVQIGLDCNNAHVQPQGKYHYHGSPTLYLENETIPSNAMTLIGYAADGFPIYFKYAYSTATDANSTVSIMTSSYRLKTGSRPGNGTSAPCGEYNGIYSTDYEYVAGLGTLDEANGRTGVTPEFPNGTYYYVVTEEFPSIPRYFKGTPSASFKI